MSALAYTLIRGARPLGGEATDLLLHDGLIVDTGRLTAPPGCQVVDADGLIVLPGLVDMHVHFREPGAPTSETIATGSAAAAAGGFTAVCAMANTDPVTDTAELAEQMYASGRRVGLVDLYPVGAVTRGLRGEKLADLPGMYASNARVRVFSDDGRCVADPAVMRQALAQVARLGAVMSQHSQEPRLAGPDACCHEGRVSEALGLTGWPGVAEEVIVARDVMLAQATGGRLHVAHVSTAASVEIIRWAKARGVPVTAEVTPHHLVLTDDLLLGAPPADHPADPVFKVNPPLRPSEDAAALQAALADGTIDIVATDHAPHAAPLKDQPFPDAAFGMIGIETVLSVVSELMVRTGRMSWADVARVMSSAPAAIAGLDGPRSQGGPLVAGAPATLVLIDPDRVVTVHRDSSKSLSRNNPWHTRTLTGAPVATYLRGARTDTPQEGA